MRLEASEDGYAKPQKTRLAGWRWGGARPHDNKVAMSLLMQNNKRVRRFYERKAEQDLLSKELTVRKMSRLTQLGVHTPGGGEL